MSVDPESELLAEGSPEPEKAGSTALRVITWFSVGIAVAAIGIYVGTALRKRYRFKRRTPYDFYSNAGSRQASEFGVGI
jgi:hypothetical protein